MNKERCKADWGGGRGQGVGGWGRAGRGVGGQGVEICKVGRQINKKYLVALGIETLKSSTSHENFLWLLALQVFPRKDLYICIFLILDAGVWILCLIFPIFRQNCKKNSHEYIKVKLYISSQHCSKVYTRQSPLHTLFSILFFNKYFLFKLLP